MNDEVIVFDDLIPLDLQDKIFFETTSIDFPWFLYQSTVDQNTLKVWKELNPDLPIKDCPQFVHQMSNYDSIVSPYFLTMATVFSIVGNKLGVLPTLENILRLKSNLIYQHPLEFKDTYSGPHVDISDDPSKWIMIYYVNDSDGDTFIFNEKGNYTQENKTFPNNLTIKKRISPKKGRIVLFKGDLFHAGSAPINSKYRVILNFNLNINL